jgi:hypothetical protein
MAVEVSSAQQLDNQGNIPVQFHQRHQRRLYCISIHLIISSHLSENPPALIPIIAVSAMIEFCPTRSTFTPHC